jgi:hypothetical protein
LDMSLTYSLAQNNHYVVKEGAIQALSLILSVGNISLH